MSDSETLVRQWLLLKLLSSRKYGMTVDEMAHEMSVHVKTVRRYIKLFRKVGFSLVETKGDHNKKIWRIKNPSGQPPLTFQFDEAFALYLGRRFLDPLAGTVFWDACQRAFKKIRASLGEPAIQHLNRLAGRIHSTNVGASDYSDKADAIDQLMVAIEDSKEAVITYTSAKSTEPVEYAVRPYGLAYHRGSLYLIGHSIEHNEVRHFKIDRLHEIEVSGLAFERPNEFDVEKHLADSFGVFHGAGDVTVRVWFSADVARYVRESRWHVSQKLEGQPDGSLIAEFRLSATEEIRSWVLSFGSRAEILEPPEMRECVTKELQELVRRYEKDQRYSATPHPKSNVRFASTSRKKRR